MIRKNIVANIIGRVWSFISVYLFVPLYLRFLGIEAYGMIGFYSTLLGVMVLADMGFTAALNREMARLSAKDGSIGKMRDLLRTYETTYAFFSLLISLLIYIFAPTIAHYWLQAKDLNTHEITLSIRLMGVAIAFQLPSMLFVGGLMGLERQMRANLLQISWGLLRGFGAVLVLWLLSPTIIMFACWQLISNIIYCFGTRFSLWQTLSSPKAKAKPRFKIAVFHRTWRYAGSMAGMAFLSMLMTQLDKLVVSKILSLEMFGYYTLATALATTPIMLANPISLAVFPRLTGYVETGNQVELNQLYYRACELVAVVIIPAGITIAFFSDELIIAWTGSAEAARNAGLVVIFLIVGQLIQALMIVPYHLALAHGSVLLNIQVGIGSVFLVIPLLIFLVTKNGITGAGVSWLIMNVCTLPVYMFFLHRRFLYGSSGQWYLRCIAFPLFAAFPFAFLGRWLIVDIHSRTTIFCLVGIVWVSSTVSTAFAVKGVRSTLINICRAFFVGVPKPANLSDKRE